MKPVVILLLSAVIFSACSKELSEEGGPGGVNPPVGDNCKISKLVEIDSTSGEGLFSNQTTFDAYGRATAVRLYDSVLGNVDYATSIVYTGDTARISADEFFLLDANGRVRTFYSTNNASGIADTVITQYRYDPAGYLVAREFFFPAVPLPFFRYAYTWRNGDLAEMLGQEISPGSATNVLSAEMEYNSAVTLQTNLLPLADAFEVNIFLSAFDLGRVPLHPLTLMRVTIYDGLGNPAETFVQQYRSYEISPDGYIRAFSTYTEPTATSPAVTGRARLEYFCR
jgi:hypothetical protein